MVLHLGILNLESKILSFDIFDFDKKPRTLVTYILRDPIVCKQELRGHLEEV
jgi:hypothetical protein